MKNAFYFKHDLNAHADEKIVGLRMKLGAAGYGTYWLVVEKLYDSKGRLGRDYQSLSWDIHVDPQIIKRVVEDFDLFYNDKGKIACRRVDEGLADRASASEQARLAGRASAAKRALNGRSTVVERSLNVGEDRIGEERREEKDLRTGPVDKPVDFVDKCEFYSKAEGKCTEPPALSSRFCQHHIRKFQERNGGRGIVAALPQIKETPRKEIK